MARSTASQSAAERAMGPSLSSDQERAIAPARDTRPKVGRSPETPQNDEGQMIEPQVSEPMPNGTSAAATAAPVPEDDPQVHRSRFQGFSAAPVREESGVEYPRPPASSTIASFPRRTAPAPRSVSTIPASRSGTRSA